MSEVSVDNQADEQVNVEDQAAWQLQLPPGFRFHPSDEEVISQFLMSKALDRLSISGVIGEVNLDKSEPPLGPASSQKSKMREEWSFFSKKDSKYLTRTRTNRATATASRTRRATRLGCWRGYQALHR